MNYDRSERIRRAAILVASLEESMAQQMLDSLPQAEAGRILAEVDRLGELDPEELQDVLDEFKSAGRRGRASEEAVEFTYSAPKPALSREAVAVPTDSIADDAAKAAAAAQEDSDATLMAELLTHEQPQTTAAALSRLGHDQGAAVFAKLPAAIQADVLDRLAILEPADEDAVQELESQLQRRVEQHRQRRDRAIASAELARRMVAKTPAAQRDSLLARLSPSGQTQDRMATAATVRGGMHDSVQSSHQAAARLSRLSVETEPYAATDGFEVWTDEPAPRVATSAASMRVLLEDRSHELEALDDRSLLEALRAADERTVQCALAASSERFLNRVAGKLPRRQASRLREMVRSIGPTRLTELREAQHELLRLAHSGRRAEVAA